MHVDAARRAFRAPVRSAVLEVADELFFLRIDGDDRLMVRLRRNDVCIDMLELRVAVGMFRALMRLAIELARKAEFDQFLAHGVGADRMAHRGQRSSEFVHALGHPCQGPHGIAQGRGLDEPLEVGNEAGINLATARRPPPARRTLSLASGSASRSSSPRLIVEQARPAIRDTMARPPRPAVRTSAAANNRRPRSSSLRPTVSQR